MTDPQNSTQAAADLTEQEQGALTASDIASLQEYLDKTEELAKREPPMLSGEFWNKFFEDTKGMDEIPPEYQDKVCIQDVIVHSEIVDGKHRYIPEGKTVKGYSDIVWENWNSESVELEKQYSDIIVKALKHAAQNPQLMDGARAEKMPESMLVDKLLQNIIDSKIPEIPRLTSINPLSHVMANNSLMNTLTSLKAINAGPFDMPVINKKGKRKEITAYTIASYDQDKDGAGELIKSKLTECERQVSDAVISIWEEARKSGLPPEFTTDMVFRAMPGSGDKPSPQQAGAITRTIEKLRNLHIYLDVTEEMRVRGLISDKEQVILDDKFLSAGRVTRKIKNGGQTVIAYHLHTEPLVLSYCKMTNQLITVSPKWLEVKKVKGGKTTKEAVLMTQERQAITGYLIRRIAIMKNDKKNKKPTQSNTILLSTLFDDIGIAAPDKQKAADIRKFCFDVLDYYKAEKIITDYEKQTKGQSITGIIIDL